MDDFQPGPTRLLDLWPRNLKGRRNYKFAQLRWLPASEWTELARLLRKRITKHQGGPHRTGAKRSSKRQARRIIRRMRSEPGVKRSVIIPKRMLVGRKRPCRIMERLLPERDAAWTPILARRKRHQIQLESFSLIDHPEKVVADLRTIAQLEATSAGVTMDFSDEACTDVSAYLVLGLMTQNMIRVLDGGRITPSVRSMLNAVDLAPFMGVRSVPDGTPDPTFMPFRLRRRRPAGSSSSQDIAAQPTTNEKLNDDLTATINRWLKVCRRPPMTKEMMGYVAQLVGEVLDNAVRHSHPQTRDGDWAMAGFLSPARLSGDPERVYFVCSLAMVSIGATVHESLSESQDVDTVRRLREYVGRHTRQRGGQEQRDPEVELLTTIFALQDGVSRLPQGEDDSRGGIGLMDTVQFMNEIGNVVPQGVMAPCMTLLSGRACLQLRGPYRDAPHREEGVRRELWFNLDNTLEQPPDSAYVRLLPHGFPGTIVALRFCVGTTGMDGLADRDVT